MTLSPDEAFAPLTECAPLVDSLRERIARDGRITFRDFMEAALYDPRHGYYVTRPYAPSPRGDFATSPEVHPVFGAFVARQIAEMWDLMDRPARFDVVEPGGGSGTLARQIVEYAEREPEFAEALQYTVVERRWPTPSHDAVVESGIEWAQALPQHITGCLLSNEFFDALPVHRVKRDADKILEVYVTLSGKRFVETLDEPSTPEIERYFAQLGMLPGEECFAEVNLAAVSWMGDIARKLDRGYVLMFDYGYEASDLYASWRRDGTLRCFYRQSMSSDPYQRVGVQDMTSSVDFTSLREAGERDGLRTLGYTNQATFLMRLGIGEGVAAVTRGRTPDMEEYFARRNVMLDLIDPAKLGRIKVLAQGKNVPASTLAGFHDDE